jgi:hypothetical protein
LARELSIVPLFHRAEIQSQHFTLIHTTPLQFLVLWNGSEKNPFGQNIHAARL